MQTGGPRGRMLSEINVTPFVDVMLVLLIIFMVTAPMMTQGIDVNLPRADSSSTIQTEEERYIVTVASDGKLYINEYQVELDSLGPKLAALLKEPKAGQGVFLRADRNVPYGTVVQVMSHIREAGINQIGMVTEITDNTQTPSAR